MFIVKGQEIRCFVTADGLAHFAVGRVRDALCNSCPLTFELEGCFALTAREINRRCVSASAEEFFSGAVGAIEICRTP